MKTEEAKKNIQETLSKLESFNRDSDPVCKLSSSEISYSFFGRSVFYFEQII